MRRDAVVVLSTMRFTEALLERLRRVAPDRLEVHQVTTGNVEEIPADLKEAVEVLYTFNTLPRHREEMPNLRWIQLHSAGVEHVPRWLREESGILITTTSGIHAVPIAEYVFMSILAYFRRLPRMLYYQQRGEWPRGRWALFADGELRGATMGVVGYGSIGREVGRLAKAFGMRLLAMRRHGGRREDRGYVVPGTGDPEGGLPDDWYTPDQVLEMLPQCDVVVVALPLTEETRGFIGARELAAMKPTAYLVNVGRGPTVDEAALVQALQKGQIGGAGLDVFEEEPLPPDSPLWRLENVILSPHVSAFSTRYDDRATALFAANLERYLAGRPLYNLYQRELGY